MSSILLILLVPSCRVLWILELLPELNQYKILSLGQGEVLEILLEKHWEILAPRVSPPSSSLPEATPLSMLGRLVWPVLLKLIMD
jgi:hypothetical protein